MRIKGQAKMDDTVVGVSYRQSDQKEEINQTFSFKSLADAPGDAPCA